MIIVADSGSTKTDWALMENNKLVNQFESPGMNPMTQSSAFISELLNGVEEFQQIGGQVKLVYYYGAGCSNDSKKQLMKNALREKFPNSEINIEHDLLGSAISLCGNKKGIVCILGTGSNCCYYDGKKVHDQRFGHGYIYGDEGSGFDMGKRLVRMYLSNELPDDLNISFENKFALTRELLLNNTYSHSHPNSYVAQFTKFLSENLNNVLIKTVISDSFESFIINNVQKIDVPGPVNINSVGSIGWVFKDILSEACSKHGISIGRVIQKPIDGLIKHHLRN